jgi:hypothetical protein
MAACNFAESSIARIRASTSSGTEPNRSRMFQAKDLVGLDLHCCEIHIERFDIDRGWQPQTRREPVDPIDRIVVEQRLQRRIVLLRHRDVTG